MSRSMVQFTSDTIHSVSAGPQVQGSVSKATPQMPVQILASYTFAFLIYIGHQSEVSTILCTGSIIW